MARFRRIHVPGGIHYLTLHGNPGREIFLDDGDYRGFAKLVERYARRCRARIHAFCWTAREVHFVVQISTEPLGRFVQRTAGQHARHVNRKLAQRGQVFQQRYRAVLVKRPADLPRIVRHIHLLSLRAGLTSDPAEYLWSSHRTYLGVSKIGWVTTGTVLRMLESPGRYRRAVYREYVHEESERIRGTGFGAMDDQRTADAQLIAQLTTNHRARCDAVLLNRIIDGVAMRLAVSRAAIFSPSRQHCLVLARALVAWYATNCGAATLTQVAQYFNRNPATLSVAVERYRRARRDLFERPTLDPPARPPEPAVETLCMR